MARNANTTASRNPTSIYFNDGGQWKEEAVRTVTNPAAWGTKTVITVTGRRFSVSASDIVLVY